MRNAGTRLRLYATWLPLCILYSFLSAGFAAEVAAPLEVAPLVPVSPFAEPEEARPGLLRLGVFEFFPRISASVIYDDNIEIRPTNEEDDLIWAVAPAVSFVASEGGEAAKSIVIRYSPRFVFFTDHDEHNTVGHEGRLAAVWPMARLTLGASQSYSRSESGVTDVGDRIEQRAYNTALTSAYEVSEKTLFQVNAGLAISEFDDLNGARTYSNNDWFNYQVTTRIRLGLGGAFGYVDVDLGPNQVYEQALARAIYAFTDKVNFQASVGGEWRQYRGDTPASDRFAMVFNVAGNYRPVEGTTITLEGHRQNQVSAIFANQNFIATGGSVALRQRMFEKLAGTVVAGYDHADYHASIAGVTATRADDYYSVRVALDVNLRERWTAGVSFLYRKNASNIGAFDFDNRQIGVHASWSY